MSETATGRKPLSVTVATVCALTGLGPTTVWQLIKEGRLEVARIGRRTLVRYTSLERLLESEGKRGRNRAADNSAGTRMPSLSPPQPKP